MHGTKQILSIEPFFIITLKTGGLLTNNPVMTYLLIPGYS